MLLAAPAWQPADNVPCMSECASLSKLPDHLAADLQGILVTRGTLTGSLCSFLQACDLLLQHDRAACSCTQLAPGCLHKASLSATTLSYATSCQLMSACHCFRMQTAEAACSATCTMAACKGSRLTTRARKASKHDSRAGTKYLSPVQ